ncbi:transposase [Aeromonas sanarellii]|nr:transposase [Aeromonas sanarellii]
MAGVLVAGLYAGYRFVCTSLRLLCWAHVLRNVAVIAQSGERFRQRLLSLVETTKRLGRCPQE